MWKPPRDPRALEKQVESTKLALERKGVDTVGLSKKDVAAAAAKAERENARRGSRVNKGFFAGPLKPKTAADVLARRGLIQVPKPSAAPAPTGNNDQIRGISRRDHIAWLLFRALARGDFQHDFGENKPDRDKITDKDENRFFEIAKRVSKKGSVELRSKFKNYIGRNLRNIIADQIDIILPQPVSAPTALGEGTPAKEIHDIGVAPGQFAEEDELLHLIGIDWVQLKREVVGLASGASLTKTLADTAVAGGRTYEIRACPYRRGARGEPGYDTNTAPIEALNLVSGGKTDFALIIDASGGLPLSDLRDRTLLTGAGGGKVYIIENIENGADSATKLLPPPIRPKGPAQLPPAPDLKFLRDNVNTVNYPLWGMAGDQKSNIYSSLFIILNRISDDNVESNLLIKNPDGSTKESFSIGDIANASNVKNSSLYALAMLIEHGGVTNEMLIYTLIKRMGDWCQALSLLDLDRIYTVYNDDKATSSEGGGQSGGAKITTLRELQATTEIGILTNDRILLAFCIMLGLNVFYTSGMDIARLIYFKNTRDLPSGPALAAVVEALLQKINRAAVEAVETTVGTHEAAVLAARDAFIAGRMATPDIADYILALRSLLSNLGRLRFDFAQSVDQIKASYAVAYTATASPTDRLTAANVLISVMTKVELDIKYNESVLADLANPANPSVDGKERIRLDALKRKLASGGRIAKSVEVTEAKEILLETRNDIRQILGKPAPLLVGGIFRTTLDAFGIKAGDRAETNYQELLSVFPAILILLPGFVGGQRGGGTAMDINNVYDAIGVRTIRLLDTPGLEVTSTTNIYEQGSTYYDATLTGYTVADENIVTKDDLPLFGMVFVGGIPAIDAVTSRKLRYICNRYLLLVVDIAMNDLQGIVQEAAEDEEGDPGVFELGVPTRTRYNQIIETWHRVDVILNIGDTGDFNSFINATVALYETPPTEEVQEVGGAGPGLKVLRERLIANIASYSAGPSAERNETRTREQALGRVAETAMQDAQIVEPLVARMGIPPGDQATSLGDAIRATITGVVLETVDPETATGIITTAEIVAIPGLTEAIQRTVAEWGGGDGANSGMIATHIKSIQMGLAQAPPVRAAAAAVGFMGAPVFRAPAPVFGAPAAFAAQPPPAPFGFQGYGVAAGQGPVPGQWGYKPVEGEIPMDGMGLGRGGSSTSNASDSPSGGVRRKLYAGLRKRSGSSPDPSLR